MSNFAELTKYKKMYKDTYWGRFILGKREDEEKEKLKEIFSNRNKFIEEYKIKSPCSKTLKYVCNFFRTLSEKNKKVKFDHTEVYKLENGNFLVLNNPYGECDDDFAKLGWTKIYCLYLGATSYIKVFTPEEFRQKKTNKDYLKTFYEVHQEYAEKQTCEICGEQYMFNNKSRHDGTKIHKYAVKKLEQI